MGIDLILAVFGGLLPGYTYTTTYVGGFSEMLYQTRVGICDVAVDDLFQAWSRSQCTECALPPADTSGFTNDFDWEDFACCIEFSHAFFSGGGSLLTLSAQDSSSVNVFSIISQKSIIQAVCYATLLTFAIAHVIWLCERTVYEDELEEVAPSYLYPRKYLDGLREGTWFASTTAMSNALHNKTVVTGPGRLVAAVWVAFGMFLTAFVTSIFSSTLTAQKLQAVTITTAAHMAGRSLCIESGFYDIFWDLTFPAIGVRKTYVDNVLECYPAVANGSVDATFSICEIFVAYFTTGAGAGLSITPVVTPQDYAIAWNGNFTGRKDVNTALLGWTEGVVPVVPAFKDSVARWYGGNAGVFVYGSGTEMTAPWNWPLIIATCVILGVYMLLQAIVVVGAWAHRRHDAQDGPLAMLDTIPSLKRKSHLSFLAKASAMLSSNIDHHEMKRSQSLAHSASMAGGSMSSHLGGGASTNGTFNNGTFNFSYGGAPGSSSSRGVVSPLKLLQTAGVENGSRRHNTLAFQQADGAAGGGSPPFVPRGRPYLSLCAGPEVLAQQQQPRRRQRRRRRPAADARHPQQRHRPVIGAGAAAEAADRPGAAARGAAGAGRGGAGADDAAAAAVAPGHPVRQCERGAGVWRRPAAKPGRPQPGAATRPPVGQRVAVPPGGRGGVPPGGGHARAGQGSGPRGAVDPESHRQRHRGA